MSGKQRAPRSAPRIVLRALALTWRADPAGFLIAAGMQILGALAAVGLVVVGKLVLDSLLASPRSISATELLPTFVLLAVVSTVTSVLGAFQTQQQRLLSERVSQATWRDVLEVSTQVELERYEMVDYYDHLQRVQNNSISQPFAITSAVLGLLGGAFTAVGLVAFVFLIEPLLVPLLLAAGVPTLLWSRRTSRMEFAFVSNVTATYRKRHYLRTLMTGRDQAKEIRAYGSGEVLRRLHEDRTTEYYGVLRKHVIRRQIHGLVLVLLASAALSLTLAVMLFLIAEGRIELAGAGAAVLAIRMLSTRLDQIFRAMAALFESSLFLSDLQAFIADGRSRTTATDDDTLTLRESVTVRNVSYTYPGSSVPALSEIDLEIPSGQVIALVGENGSGKTTLAKIIAGLYRPQSGAIRWDGRDVAEVPAAHLRRNVSVIFQDYLRYQLTALENIGLGEPRQLYDLDAAREAASATGAAQFIEKLDSGYNTILSKEFAGGTDLSLGQWQRVALARAIRRRASLVILDEPTAALDPRGEYELFTDIRRLLKGRSAVIVSHRFSTVREADCIYVMHAGRIVESGDHDALIDRGGVYAELFDLQTRAYL